MYFNSVIVIGSGKIACECSKTLFSGNIKHKAVEVNPSPLSMMTCICKKNGIEMIERKNHQTLENALLSCADGETLIISANNEHIFKKEIFIPGITIINFHYGYLPDYRGMNIPTWVIYNNEEAAGATWHYVNERIDDGEIIIQEKFPIGSYDTALDITKQVMYRGTDMFNSFIRTLLEEPVKGKPNKPEKEMHIYTRRQLPENGLLDISEDSVHKDGAAISRILRAYDYGPAEYIPKLQIKLNNEIFKLEKYRIYENGKLMLGSNRWEHSCSLVCGDHKFELLLN